MDEERYDPNEMFLDVNHRMEYETVLLHIMKHASELPNPHDRIRVFEWCKKLSEMGGSVESERIRNHYAQNLVIMIRTKPVRFFQPFKNFPPEGRLVPLSVSLGNMIAESSGQPRAGAMQPIICHQSEDAKAFLTVKKCPDGGIYCYMSVTPDNFH